MTRSLIMTSTCALGLIAVSGEVSGSVDAAQLNYAGSAVEGVEIVEQNANIPVKFENAAGTPLVITKATAKKAADGNSSSLDITVSNKTNRRIIQYALSIEVRSRLATYSEPPSVIEPNATETTSALVLTGDTDDLLIKVTGVQFKDGSMWGTFLPPSTSVPKSPQSTPKSPQATPKSPASSPKPPKSSPKPPKKVSSTPSEGMLYHTAGEQPEPGSLKRELPVQFRNADGAPLVVKNAKANVEQQNGSQQGTSDREITFIEITVSNATDRRIVRYAFTIKTPRRVAVYSEQVEAIAPQGADSIGPFNITSDTKDMLVEVVGVQFEDETVWGMFTPPARS